MQPEAMTVSQFSCYINELVSMEPVLVEGEVSNFREIPGRNFCYFDIKDENSVARCFQGFWKSKKVLLENGAKVQVFGNPSLQKNGTFVIDVLEILLSGKGALMEAYNKLKAQLEKEGLFDLESKKQLPLFPRKIGLIAGKNSSAFHDVTAEIFERWGGSDIYFLPCKVQGIGAKSQVVEAIRYFNRQFPVDVLIVARGGGSMEDLQAFDSEEVVREIFASKIPLISAIGHEDHWTLSDFVSDVRAKTPTKAGQLAVPDRKEIKERLEQYSKQASQLVDFRVRELSNSLLVFLNSSAGALKSQIEIANSRLEQRKNQATEKIFFAVEAGLEKLRVAERALSLLNPLNVLSRGYLVIEKDGKKVVDIKQLRIGDDIEGRLHNGKFIATIGKVSEMVRTKANKNG